MADYDAILRTLVELSALVSEARALVQVYQRGQIESSDINFTATQKQELVSRYNTVKNQMVAKFQELP